MAKPLQLAEIAKINPKTDFRFTDDELCSFVPMEAVDDVSAQVTKFVMRPYREVAKGYTSFAENDVIVAKITPCMENGKCAIASNLRNGVGFGSTEFHVLRATNKVLPKWLLYFWRLPETRLQAERSMTGSAGQKRVASGFLEGLEIPIPDLGEQQRLVGMLEQVDRLCRTRRYALELSNTFLPAIFVEMFGNSIRSPNFWPIYELNDACEKITDGTHFSPPEVLKGFPYITAKNIKKDGIDISGITFVSEQHHREIYSRCDPKLGDVLYIKDGVTTGIAQVNKLPFEFSMLSSLALLRPNKNLIISEYLAGYLNSPSVYRRITSQMIGGAIKRLTVERIKGLQVVVPPLPLQQKFALLVERHERLRAGQREALRQAEHLFQTLLHQAFATG